MTVGKLDSEKTAQARSQMEYAASAFWKPKAGNGTFEENFIRILPPHEKMEGKLFQPVALHWMPDKTAYVCPRRMLNGKCPLCDKGFELVKLQGKDAARPFWPNWVAYLNIMVLNKDGSLADEEVKLWSANRDVSDLLLELVEECGDFTDLETGRNVMVKAKKVEEGGFAKHDYIIRAHPNPSRFSRPDLVEAGLNDPTTVNPLLPAEEMQRLVTMLIQGPGAERADPLALPPAQQDGWGDGELQVAPPAAEEPPQQGDGWGPEDTSPSSDPAPTPAAPKKGRGKKADAAEDVEAQKQRLREELRS